MNFGIDVHLILKFSKHLPSLLRKQYLDSLLQFDAITDVQATTMVVAAHGETPAIQHSIKRFYGTLLLVDISGFTNLSQNLSLDTLKLHISSFFELILSEVDKHGGDVIKFAGDCLYIVWFPKSAQDFGSKVLVENAVICAKEIIARCNNYKIDLSYTESEINAKLFTETEPLTSPPKTETPRRRRASYIPTQHSLLLNVHCAISEGLMAGVDVGYMDRWEFFILGRPLDEAARALNDSQLGELVLSSSAHRIYHEQQEEWEIREGEAEQLCSPSCGCRCTPSKYFNVDVSVLKVEETGMCDHEFYAPEPMHHYELLVDDVFNYMEAFKESLFVKFPILNGLRDEDSISHGLNYIQGKLLNHLVRHVHSLCRDNFVFKKEYILVVDTERKNNPPPSSSDSSGIEENPSESDKALTRNSRASFVERIRELSFFLNDLVSAEIRTVVSMFIKLHVDTDLLETLPITSAQPPTVDCFNFLISSEAERHTDERILEGLQNCMVIISETILKRGGQMRQFMVDDKGTVSIGVFGLQLSESTTPKHCSPSNIYTNEDSASNAIEAGLEIISRLREIHVDASVGIAMGKVYCGLIGSVERCEYTVMGPSVNMSARLMNKAKIGDVLCDESTYLSASKHAFESLSTVVVKGYDNPVPVYKPRNFLINTLSSLSEISGGDSLSLGPKTILYGRNNCVKGIVELFFPPDPENGIVLADFPRNFSNINQIFLEYGRKQVAKLGFVSEQLSALCKVAIIFGSQGVGKSSILNYSQEIFNELNAITKLTVYSTRCTSFQMNGPFSSWGAIFRHMMTNLTSAYDSSKSGDSTEDDFSKIISMLPEEFRQQKYLLEIPLFKIHDSEISDHMSEILVGTKKIAAQIHIYAAVFELYIRKFMSPLILIVDDFPRMDDASMAFTRHIFENVRGIYILISFPSTQLNSSSTALLRLFEENTTRTKMITVEALNKETSFSLVKHLLASKIASFTPLEQGSLCTHFYDISSGVPCHIQRLATVVLESHHVTYSDIVNSISHLTFTRIESLVTQRFDQLNDYMRVLLKIASVVAFQSRSFNINILCHLSSNSGESVSEQFQPKLFQRMGEIFLSLLMNKDFVKIAAHSQYKLDKSPASDLKTLMTGIDMEFQTSDDQESIYNLLLEAQRRRIHLQIANYFISTLETSSTQSYDVINTIAVHFEEALEYSKAMCWNYRAAILLDSAGAHNDAIKNLANSYIMFEKLRKAASVGESSGPIDFQYVRSSFATGSFMARDDKITKSGLHLIFGDNPDNLEIAIKMIIKLGQLCVMANKDSDTISNLFTEAFNMILAIQNVTVEDGQIKDSIFRINMVEMFPVLSGIISQYKFGQLHDDLLCSNQTIICDLFSELTKPSEYAFHAIVARYSSKTVTHVRGNFAAGTALIDPILAYYDISTMSALLLKHYVFDETLYQIGNNALMHLALGNLKESARQLDFILSNLSQIQHVSSRFLGVLPACHLLVQFHRAAEAPHIFDDFKAYQIENSGLNIISSFVPIFEGWIQLMRSSNAFANPSECLVSEAVQEALLSKCFIIVGDQVPVPTLFCQFGSPGPECICAMMCLHLSQCSAIRTTGFIKSPLEYLNLAVEYLDSFFSRATAKSLYTFAYFSGRIIFARVLEAKAIWISGKEKDALKLSSRGILIKCATEAMNSKCWYFALLAADILFQIDGMKSEDCDSILDACLGCLQTVGGQDVGMWIKIAPVLSTVR